MANQIKRGDVVIVNLGNNTVGSEQCGEQRPCLIVSNDTCNTYSPVVTIVPLTSKVMKRNLPTHLLLTREMYPIHKDSVVLCEQLKSIDKSRITGDVLFSLNQLEMKKLDRCMAIQLGLIDPRQSKSVIAV